MAVKVPTKPAPKVGSVKDKPHPSPIVLFLDLEEKEKGKGKERPRKGEGVRTGRKKSVLQERASWNSREDAFVSVITGLWC